METKPKKTQYLGESLNPGTKTRLEVKVCTGSKIGRYVSIRRYKMFKRRSYWSSGSQSTSASVSLYLADIPIVIDALRKAAEMFAAEMPTQAQDPPVTSADPEPDLPPGWKLSRGKTGRYRAIGRIDGERVFIYIGKDLTQAAAKIRDKGY